MKILPSITQMWVQPSCLNRRRTRVLIWEWFSRSLGPTLWCSKFGALFLGSLKASLNLKYKLLHEDLCLLCLVGSRAKGNLKVPSIFYSLPQNVLSQTHTLSGVCCSVSPSEPFGQKCWGQSHLICLIRFFIRPDDSIRLQVAGWDQH